MDSTNAERQRRYIERLKARAAVSNGAGADEIASLRRQLAQARAYIAELEAHVTALLRQKHAGATPREQQFTARIAELEAQIAKQKAQPVTPQAPRAAPTNPSARTQIAKLIRMLGSPNEGEMIGAARALAKKDLHTAADVIEAWEKRVVTFRPKPPPPIDWAKIEAAITAYIEGKATVTLSNAWKIARKAHPKLDDTGGSTGATKGIISMIIRLGFTQSRSGYTFTRTT